jgi:hypothetical protein
VSLDVLDNISNRFPGGNRELIDRVGGRGNQSLLQFLSGALGRCKIARQGVGQLSGRGLWWTCARGDREA